MGHETVALIAQDRITPRARQAIQEILERETLSFVSTWADRMAHDKPETAPWHYFNLDIRQPQTAYDMADACPNHDCVVEQIERDLSVLSNGNASLGEKREALKYLVHFVGDIHQPLHCADDQDRGGNDKWFRWHGPNGTAQRYKWVNLHSLWDDLLQPNRRPNPHFLARKLEKEITPQEERDWCKGKAEDWGWESFRIAQNDIYPGLPSGPLPDKNRWGRDLPEKFYSPTMKATAYRQLEKAGVRLAWLLNGIFK
ncbi:MAG TPA: S1/P1 nuclease [bacterium]|nr:S1/P1 nuclease [bacterium]